ncbi:MAG: Gldg family protein [Eubacteriales bacterium]|nr:Gldg family protein [Eubacteriales bacterium]
MKAIYKRELKNFFMTVTGWLFIAAHICLAGLYFFAVNLLSGYGDVGAMVSSILFLLLLSTPILSMRILAEERKQKTDQLILTSPVSVGGIVAGKYLAMATVFTVPILVMCSFPLILGQYGSVPMEESYTAILVYYLFGLACLAVGMFVSSITESQVIAAVLSFAILFVAYMMSSIISLISSSGNLVTQILEAFDFSSRLDAMLGGTLDLKAVLYFVTVIFVFLFLTTQSIQKRRYQISVRSFRIGAYSTGLTAVVLVIAVFANLAVSALPDSYTTVDTTSQKLYSLTATTKNVLKALDQDVTIYVINAENNQDTMLQTTLEQYADLSGHIQIVYKDPVVSPDFYKDYTDSISINSLIVECGDRFRVINYNNIYEYDYDYTTYSQTVSAYDAEGLITSAVAYVTSGDAPVIYQVNGHGESSLESTFTEGVQKENADLAELTLLTADSVPEDADGVMILSPTSDFNEDDVQKLTDYLDRGGKILLETSYIDLFAEEMPNLSKILSYFGLSIGDGLIVEQDRDRMYQSPVYLLPEVQSDSLTSGVYGNDYDYIMMPYAQAILSQETENVTVTQLLTTSDSSYLKTGLSDTSDLSKQEGDVEGPFAVGVSAVKTLESGETAQLIVYSSSFLFTDSANQYTMNNNLTLFTNAVSAMAGESESISIPAKSYETSYVTVPAASAIRLGILFMGVIPVGLLVCGIVIWVRRKKR